MSCVVNSEAEESNQVASSFSFRDKRKRKKKKEIYDAHPAVIRLCRISSSPAATKKEKKELYIYIPRRVCTVFFFYLLEKI